MNVLQSVDRNCINFNFKKSYDAVDCNLPTCTVKTPPANNKNTLISNQPRVFECPEQTNAYGDICTSNPNYNREIVRLSTFNKWAKPYIDKEKLARFGFFHKGPEDTVKCQFCKVEIGRWALGDNVLREHIRWSPSCPLLRRRPTDNVPIDEETLIRSLPPISDNQSYEEVRLVANSEPEDIPPSFIHGDHPDFRLEKKRFDTFKEWPKAIKQKPQELSDAGFFYIGKGDQVKCFSCGGGLKDWEVDDDPWEQHALWYEECKYLNLVKSKKYIREVKEKYENQPETAFMEPENDKCLEPMTDKNENEKDDLENLCKICYVGERNTALFPCMHILSCGKCSSALTTCPVCRKQITDRKRIYFS